MCCSFFTMQGPVSFQYRHIEWRDRLTVSFQYRHIEWRDRLTVSFQYRHIEWRDRLTVSFQYRHIEWRDRLTVSFQYRHIEWHDRLTVFSCLAGSLWCQPISRSEMFMTMTYNDTANRHTDLYTSSCQFYRGTGFSTIKGSHIYIFMRW